MALLFWYNERHMDATRAMSSSQKTGRKTNSTVWVMLAFGIGTLVAGWLMIRWILLRSGLLNEMVVMAATFAPLWLGAAIGWAVGRAAPVGNGHKKWLPPVLALAIALPAAISDPWIIVALGLRRQAPLALEMLLLLLPMMVAAAFAYPGMNARRLAASLIALALLTLAVYVAIYWLILPQHNFVIMPRL